MSHGDDEMSDKRWRRKPAPADSRRAAATPTILILPLFRYFHVPLPVPPLFCHRFDEDKAIYDAFAIRPPSAPDVAFTQLIF